MLLHAAAMTHSDVFAQITARIEAKRRAEAECVISFDQLSKTIWRELYVAHAKKKSSTQFDVGFDVAFQIQSTFEDIANRAPRHASYGTKRNAIETMRKICKSILLMDGSELQKIVWQNIDELDGLMMRVLEGFEQEELARLVNEEFEGQWLDKLQELIKLSEGSCILEGLPAILAVCERAAVTNKQ